MVGKLIIGVDLGGTQIRAALADGEGSILRRTSCLTLAEEGLEPVIGRIKGAIYEVMGSTERGQVQGIGVVAPGPLDPWKGVIMDAPNLPGWKNVPLKDLMEEEFGLPVFVGNDANLAALAEQRFGAGQGVSDLIYITVSTGIGGGIIADNRLLLGAQGLAGEVGHQTIEAHGPRCNCGNIGCLEALAAGPAIARTARELIKTGIGTAIADLVGGDLDKITAREVNQAAQAGDPVAIELFRQAGFYIGIGIVNLLHLFNSSLIVIGGGVAKAGDLLFEPIRATVRERAMASYYWEHTPIVPATLGDDVALLGAVALVLLRNTTTNWE
ncbi:MAG: ROK family protein [Anaerolineales bacterium]|nr:ROK family protein [Anaerolineales bacterium]